MLETADEGDLDFDNIEFGTISTSRTFQEMLKIEHGDNAYRKLAATLDTSMPFIDSLAENVGA